MNRVALAALLCTGVAVAAPQGSVVGSKHDFSVGGGGAFRATAEGQVCIFCHALHSGGEGMTNRPRGPGRSEVSSGLERPPPGGSSRLCLSCHDGTTAVGETRTKRIAVSGPSGERIGTGRRANLGTDLRMSHPISTPVRHTAKTHSPPAGDAVKLDHAGEVQCSSCHDPHQSADAGGKFLVKEPSGSALCVSCHSESVGPAAASAHATSAATFGPAQGNEAGFRSVGEAGCDACHAVHGQDRSGRLLRRGVADGDDAACLRCHSGAVARKLVGSDVAKAHSHGEQGRGVHRVDEGPSGSTAVPERSAGATRHVVCVDCHDPHSVTDLPSVAPNAPGALAGAWGIDIAGRRVDPVRFEYEVCLKCHGDSANKPQDRAAGGTLSRPVRANPDANLRNVFSPSAPSYHPVATPGRNPDVPSLKAPWTVGSFVYCGDCHGSDAADSPSRARGPHGSVYPYLLARSYSTRDGSVESPAAYALCYKCHDRDQLLFGKDGGFVATSGKPLHALHVIEERAPCSACHASHGVSSLSGTATNNAHLIDFDVTVVTPNTRGDRAYTSRGARGGSCSVACHRTPGRGEHDNRAY
jgi:predicted CXXCH cytochrome family protein